MAFAITAYKSYSKASYEAVTAQFEQVVELTITRAATDIALDIGNVTGTFWTAADDTALGLSALANFRTVLGKARIVQGINSAEINSTFTRVISGAAGAQYQLVSTSPAGIVYTLVSGQVLATLRVCIMFSLKAGELPAAFSNL